MARISSTFSLEFKECRRCAEQPGSPTLCRSCRNNRAVIAQLKRHADLKKAARIPRGCTCESLADPALDCPKHGR